ncbi:MAG: radical SAM protein [Planctomycetota bacterium]
MSTAFLLLTTQCNRSCSYCFYETGYQDRGDPSCRLPVDSHLLRALSKAGVDKVILSGGEPLILPDIVEIAQKITDQGFFPLLLTNGELLTPGLLEQLVKAGLGAVSLSLDSMAKDGSAKAPWDVLKLVTTQDRLHSAVITPISRLNVGVASEIITKIYNVGSYALIQPVFVPGHHPLHAALSLQGCTPAERLRFEEAIQAWVALYGRSAYADLLFDFYRSVEAVPVSCTMGTDSVIIEANGDVFPCFHRRDLCAGNILRSDPDIVLAEAFKHGPALLHAPCFGEHCISLFSHLE